LVLFCEYVIPERNREAFAAWVTTNLDLWQGVELAENTAQPGVFVEIRRATDEEEAAKMEQERREGRSWKEMTQWVKGGPNGLRIWTFRPFSG